MVSHFRSCDKSFDCSSTTKQKSAEADRKKTHVLRSLIFKKGINTKNGRVVKDSKMCLAGDEPHLLGELIK